MRRPHLALLRRQKVGLVEKDDVGLERRDLLDVPGEVVAVEEEGIAGVHHLESQKNMLSG